MNVSFEELVGTIKEKSSLSEEEIKTKIDSKLNQLSGLISKEGAAHIIANELGINLSSATPSAADSRKKIKELASSDRNIEVVGRVVQVYEVREFNSNGRAGKVGNFLLGDETGVTRIVLWNDKADLLKDLKQGVIVKIQNCYARSNNDRIELHLNDNSVIELNPAGEEIAAVSNANARPDATRKKITELDIEDQNAEILGTIVQIFDPRFFEVDPDTGKRIRPGSDNQFHNAEGKEVTPDFSYVFNLFVDDGSDNIRVVCFRNQMQNVLNMSHEEVLKYREDPMAFEQKKHDLLGQMIKIQGRVVRNDMFDRLELISSRVFLNPEAKEEVERLESPKSESSESSGVETVAAAAATSTMTSSPEEPAAEPTSEPSPEKSSEEPSVSSSETIMDAPSQATPSAPSLDDLENLDSMPDSDFASADTVAEPEKKAEGLDDLGELEELEDLDDM